MNEEQKKAFLDWANELTANVQCFLDEEQTGLAAECSRVLAERMTKLNELFQ